MDDLFQSYEDDYHINNQLRQDQRDVKITQPIRNHDKLCVILRKKQTHSQLINYLHGACFSPVKVTFLHAIQRGFFKSWPGLTRNLVLKNLEDSIYTSMGHIRQERQGLQSTKSPAHPKYLDLLKKRITTLQAKLTKGQSLQDRIQQDILEDAFPTSPLPNIKDHSVVYVLHHEDTAIEKAYTDLTGRFPFQSTRGNKYILIGYHPDSNAILAKAVKDRTSSTLTSAWEQLHSRFQKAGVAPKTYVLDNECSQDLLTAFEKEKVSHQFVPPGIHRANQAERAIQTFKAHFKAGLSSVDPKFPVGCWDLLLEQAELTLNLLRGSRSNPKLSAWAYLFGEFDFSSTPLAPPGTRIVAHNKADKRKSWDFQGEQGWYIGPALQHYRCVSAYFPRTRATRVCDTVDFFPTSIPIPAVTTTDFLRQAAEDIISILTKPPSSTTPSLQAGDPVRNALLDIGTALNRIAPLPIDQSSSSLPTKPPPPDNNVLPLSPSVMPPKPTCGLHVTQPPRVSPKPSPNYDKKFPSSIPSISKQSKRYNLRPRLNKQSTNFKDLATRQLLAQHLFHSPKIHHIFDKSGNRQSIDKLRVGPDGKIWEISLSNEWGRLAQGNDNGVIGTDTIVFLHPSQVPKNRAITYANFIMDYRPLKKEQHRVRITVGGDRLPYPGDAGSPATDLTETKLLVNSVISDSSKGARFLSADLKDFSSQPQWLSLNI